MSIIGSLKILNWGSLLLNQLFYCIFEKRDSSSRALLHSAVNKNRFNFSIVRSIKMKPNEGVVFERSKCPAEESEEDEKKGRKPDVFWNTVHPTLLMLHMLFSSRAELFTRLESWLLNKTTGKNSHFTEQEVAFTVVVLMHCCFPGYRLRIASEYYYETALVIRISHFLIIFVDGIWQYVVSLTARRNI